MQDDQELFMVRLEKSSEEKISIHPQMCEYLTCFMGLWVVIYREKAVYSIWVFCSQNYTDCPKVRRVPSQGWGLSVAQSLGEKENSSIIWLIGLDDQWDASSPIFDNWTVPKLPTTLMWVIAPRPPKPLALAWLPFRVLEQCIAGIWLPK